MPNPMMAQQLMQLLASLGLSKPGGMPGVTGINPAAPPVQPPQPTSPPQGFMARLGGTLFPSTNPDQPADPAQQRQAMLQLGLGMLAAGSRGQGLGEGIYNAYGGASQNFQGAMDRAYQNSEKKRLEGKADTQRAQDLDWRKTTFGAEMAQKQLDRKLEADLSAAQIKGAGERATYASEDDRIRAETARMQLEQDKQDRELLKPIEAKIRAGTPLTQAEKDLYQLIRSGRQPSFNPLSMLFGGGMGGGMGGGLGFPSAPGSDNPLLSDPRL